MKCVCGSNFPWASHIDMTMSVTVSQKWKHWYVSLSLHLFQTHNIPASALHQLQSPWEKLWLCALPLNHDLHPFWLLHSPMLLCLFSLHDTCEDGFTGILTLIGDIWGWERALWRNLYWTIEKSSQNDNSYTVKSSRTLLFLFKLHPICANAVLQYDFLMKKCSWN